MGNTEKEGSTQSSDKPAQVTEADRHGGKQPAIEHAEREHEDSSKEDGE